MGRGPPYQWTRVARDARSCRDGHWTVSESAGQSYRDEWKLSQIVISGYATRTMIDRMHTMLHASGTNYVTDTQD